MKKLLLLLMMCMPMMLVAQNGVTVSNLAVNSGTVTFNVSWKNIGMPALWLDSVWVFVDYNDKGVMKRLPLVPGATLTATSAPGSATVIQYDDNDKGVWIVGNARNAGSFSAAVQLLTVTSDVAGVCAYASNYPPMGEYISLTHLSFTGTPMYNIVLKNEENDTIYRMSGADFDIPDSYILVSFTDATGAPGIMKCIPPATYTLQASALDFCAGSEGVQFALSGTENGRQYQLYRDNAEVGAVLDGDGRAATFSGSFNVAGTYTAKVEAEGLNCASAMNGTREVIENPLPTDPAVNNASRNCPGTVTLSASSSGALIDWYADVAATLTLHAGESYTTPEIQTSTTYYVQARFESTGCLSARVPVLAEVITDGCCHAPGTSAGFSTFNPCVTAAGGSTWTLTDERDNKSYVVKLMADNKYWMVQDLIFGSKCNKTTFKGSTSDQIGNIDANGVYYGDCRNNPTSQGGYLYDWAAAVNHAGAYAGSNAYAGCEGSGSVSNACQGICPSGWHIPTRTETVTLYLALGGTGTNCTTCTATYNNYKLASYPLDTNPLHFHASIRGAVGPTNDATTWGNGQNQYAWYHSATPYDSNRICRLEVSDVVFVDAARCDLYKSYGNLIRCMKNN